MLSSLGHLLSHRLRRWIPEPFVFAVVLTLLVGVVAMLVTEAGFTQVTQDWYRGFWMLLEFGMQMVLILATGFAIALSPPASALIDRLARLARTPGAVYVVVLIAGGLFNLVSWGWTVLAAVLGRELARRVPGVDYAYLIACVYISGQPWVGGASSSIPLLLNTEGNFLIESGVLASTIPTSETLGSSLNLAYVAMYFLTLPLLMFLMRPRGEGVRTLDELRDPEQREAGSVAHEAESMSIDGRSLADRLNNGAWLQTAIGLIALWVVARHFWTQGFSIDLNIMIFLFIALGLLAHRSPMRYGLAMKRACANAYGIVFQYPFYAGIMGIMMFSGLGAQISLWLADGASLETLPLIAQFAGAVVNFAIPSAGGEWAVIGPSLTETALSLSAHLSAEEQQAYVARIALAVAYGETSTNLLQPFFLLAVLPVMGAGVIVHARDVMGYLVLPFLLVYSLTALLVSVVPI
ncbi:short-chain fatty acid transporter [Wenzhouxiangella marina]|uniref:Short-chain fatty acids transporter n=1 Tax=Wenzhouxiangella marina TaxID=1579979 RepID=A0A0K0XTZ3_9GAMM|nr:TIGR00366 family protein [Wenzhouxiangella marina]AKS41130.1 Short-chain fatty acids transporter [Wenzhouxiangella marina]MBB6088009.1 short-chain fatty acids transporter [Wenzhouxiangella marina]